jgi:hypothetical protein
MALTFSVPTTRCQVQFSGPTDYAVGTKPAAIAVGDFNGDAIPDLAVANTGDVASGDDGNVGILLGKGDGTFGATRGFDAGKNPWSIVVGDFNHDGNLDLAVRDGGETSVSILLGNGDGSFRPPVKFTVGEGGAPETIIAADFDGGGNLDVAVTNSDGTISVLLGNGDGTFRPAVAYSVPRGEPIALIAGDFNGDRKVDIAVSSEMISSEHYDGRVFVFLGNGDGSFQPPLETVTGRCLWIAAGDFNGDGQLDIVLTVSNFFRTTDLALMLGNGDGTFQPAVDIDPTKTLGTLLAGKQSPVVADFNNDLKPDVAVGVSYIVGSGSPPVPPVLRVLLGNGDGTFQAREDTALPFLPYSLYVGDFNRDKSPDVVITNDNPGISVLLNTTIAPADFPLVVTQTGSGSGSVTSSPPGIDCGVSCTARFPAGTNITLTASPDLGSAFSGWGGPCSGTGTCVIAVDASTSVMATFSLTSSTGDFSVTPATSSLSLKRGGQTSDTVTFAAQGGFKGTISLACSVGGPAPIPTCGISPASVQPGTSAILTVSVAALTASVATRPFERAGPFFAMVLPLCLMGLVWSTCFDKKRMKFWALSLLMVLATILPAACGGSSNSAPPPLNYTVTITALSGAIQHSTTVSLTVN